MRSRIISKSLLRDWHKFGVSHLHLMLICRIVFMRTKNRHNRLFFLTSTIFTGSATIFLAYATQRTIHSGFCQLLSRILSQAAHLMPSTLGGSRNNINVWGIFGRHLLLAAHCTEFQRQLFRRKVLIVKHYERDRYRIPEEFRIDIGEDYPQGSERGRLGARANTITLFSVGRLTVENRARELFLLEYCTQIPRRRYP